LHLESMAHALGQLRLESIEVRAPLIEHAADRAVVGVNRIGRIAGIGSAEEISVNVSLGPKVSGGS
jgi:hypothetical protein